MNQSEEEEFRDAWMPCDVALLQQPLTEGKITACLNFSSKSSALNERVIPLGDPTLLNKEYRGDGSLQHKMGIVRCSPAHSPHA